MTNPINYASTLGAALDSAQLGSGTGTDAGALSGVEALPVSRGSGRLQTSLSKIADFVLGQLTLANYTALRAYSGVRTYAVITSAGVAGQFAKLASPAGLSDNGGTILFDANGNAWQRLFSGQVIAAEWFGWVGGEPGAVLNAAQAAAVYHGCTTVTYNSANYLQTTPINAVNGIVIQGPGMGPEGVIRVVAGTSIDAQYQTPAFETQYAAGPTTVASGVIRDFGLRNVCLDGNCGSNKLTPVVTNGLKGMGIRVYGARPRFKNVRVIRQPGIGVYSYFTTTPTEVDFGNNLITELRDGSYFDNINVADTQFEGLIYGGPSDIDVGRLKVAWPSNSLWNTAWSNTKSLLYPKGRLRRVLSTAAGTGYVQATTTYSIATDATTPPTVQPVIVSGGIDHWIVLTQGSADATYCTITVTGAGTGAAAACYIGNWPAGVLVMNAGAQFDDIHSYGNAQGPAIEVRNDDSGVYPRFIAGRIMGESSWGGVLIGDHAEYQIAACDTHGNGGYSSPAVLPSLMITSDHGGTIANWKERRDLASGNGALSYLLRGRGNVLRGRVQGNSGYAGDAGLIGGTGNTLDIEVQDISGYAVSVDYDMLCADVRLVSVSNAGVIRNYANDPSISNVNSNFHITSYGSVALATSYSGLNNFGTGQWRQFYAIDRRSDNGSIAYAHGSVSATVDLTSTSLQTFTVNNPCVRIPAFSDFNVQITPNSGASVNTVSYANVTAVSQTQLTIQVKLAVAGTGNGQVLVNW